MNRVSSMGIFLFYIPLALFLLGCEKSEEQETNIDQMVLIEDQNSLEVAGDPKTELPHEVPSGTSAHR